MLEQGAQALPGALFFLAFFLATSLYVVLPIGFIGYLPRQSALIFVGRLASVLMGMFLLYKWASLVMPVKAPLPPG
jgi:hypothetical protein